MRSGFALVIALLTLLAACDTAGTPTTADPLLPPPDPGIVSSPTTSTTVSPAPIEDPSPYWYEGVLPSGIDYVARVPGDYMEPVTDVTGAFSYVMEDELIDVGEVRYLRVDEDAPIVTGYHEDVLKLRSGQWVVEIYVADEVLTDLGDRAEEVVTRAIGLRLVGDLPVVTLSSPFTWVEGSPQVRYQTFVVASGCWEAAARCSANHVVQVVSGTVAFVGTTGLTADRVESMTIDTNALRPASDPHYLNPGPLSERNSADLIWTGKEMIVWGGELNSGGPRAYLLDGAAFNPETDGWRMLAPIPLDFPSASRAVWADEEMIVVAVDGTLAYNPETDNWRPIADGALPPGYPDRIIWVDGRLYMWPGSLHIWELSVADGEWSQIETPDSGASQNGSFFGAMRTVNGRLFVATVPNGLCFGRLLWELVDGKWEPLPEVSLATETGADCSFANQTAATEDNLVIWSEEAHTSMAYSLSAGIWRDISPIPFDGSEGRSGPVVMDDHRFLVPRYGEAAIFDAMAYSSGPTPEQWVRVTLPGRGTDNEIIWTGEEFLAWGIWGALDAWRWTPPEGLLR